MSSETLNNLLELSESVQELSYTLLDLVIKTGNDNLRKLYFETRATADKITDIVAEDVWG